MGVRVGSAAAALVLAAAIGVFVTVSNDPQASTAPSTPPSTACADPVPGPSSAPEGAVTVDPAVVGDVSTKTDTHPAGTMFWLAPGVHTMVADQYAQVIPKNGNTYLGAPGAVFDGRSENNFAFTQQAEHVRVAHLEIRGFVSPSQQGVVNHDSGDGWVIEHNNIHHNKGAALMAGANQVVRGNCLKDNGQYAMNAYDGTNPITGLLVEGNEIVGNNTDDWETQIPGCGCSGGIKFWAVNGADVRNNWVHHNHGVGLWADNNNNDFLFENNLIEANEGIGLFYEQSYNATVRDNTLRNNAWKEGREFADRGDNFPIGAMYVSESGGDSRLPARTTKLDIHNNVLENNWDGIVLWENADRFCNSPANTGSDCTLILGIDQQDQCTQPGIASEPLYGDCRWKTHNVDIHHNTFTHDPAAVDGGCPDGFCGRHAVFSNWGTYPDWSPYMGDVIQQAITFNQSNHWHDNTYTGVWKFMPFDTGRLIGWDAWRADPYFQDPNSTSNGSPTTTTEPPPEPPVVIEAADFETDTENHVDWYSTEVTRSTTSPLAGAASLLVETTGDFGSGVQLSNWPGYGGVEAGQVYDFSVLYRETAATMPTVSWNIDWSHADGSVARTDVVTMPRTTEPATVGGQFTAPADAVNVRWTFTYDPGADRPAFQIDDLLVQTTG